MSDHTPQSLAKEGEKLARSGKTGLAKLKFAEACQLAEANQQDPETFPEITDLAQCLVTLENLENARKLDPKAFNLFLKTLTPLTS